jgi:hypothetical protein
MAELDDEIVHYIEYLQRQLLTAGAEACFDHDTLLQRRSPTDQGIAAYPMIYSEDVRNEYEAGARSFVLELSSTPTIRRRFLLKSKKKSKPYSLT